MRGGGRFAGGGFSKNFEKSVDLFIVNHTAIKED